MAIIFGVILRLLAQTFGILNNTLIFSIIWIDRGVSFTKGIHLDFTFNCLIYKKRWGDAPVHSIYIATTLRKSDIHAFTNIGYFHPGFMQCSEEGPLKETCKCPKGKNGKIGIQVSFFIFMQ